MSIESSNKFSKFVVYPIVFSIIISISASSNVMAQEAAEESAGALEEVIVTATKREESIMDVPISITAVSGEEVQAIMAGSSDIRNLRGRIPSLNIESSFGRIFPRFYIRGWGNTDFDINASQPVSLVYDEVVQENPILKGFPMFDLQAVEVLRGPQGTLFGRNTPAGVIHVKSKKPTWEKDGYFKIGLTDEDFDFEGAIGGGWGDNFSTRLSYKYMDRDDWVDNGFTGERSALGGFRETAVRWQLMYENDSFNALFNVHLRDLRGTARLFRANIIKKGSNGGLVDDFDEDEIFIDGQNDQDLDAWGGSARLEWDFDRTTLTSITGYETFDSFSVGDIDGGFGHLFAGVLPTGPGIIPFDAETADGVPSHDQFTQEIRWASNDWGRLDWQVGFFYFKEDMKIDTINYATSFGGFPNGFVFQQQDTKAWAFFGNIDYDLSDDIFLRAGLRYSDDDKDFVAERTLSPLSIFGVPPIGPIHKNADDSEISWDVSLTKAFTDDTNVYVRVAKGFRAPSIQGRLLFGDTVSVADSETVISLEGGVKTTFADGRGRLAFNLFYYTVDDAQLTAVGGAANFNQVINADKVKGQGFEFDAQWAMTDNFLLTLGASFNDTEIDDSNLAVAPCGQPIIACTVLNPPGPVAGSVLIDGNSLPQAPDWIFSATARWSRPTAAGEIYVFGDYFYRDDVNFFLYVAREYKGKALDELGLRIGYTWDDGRYDVAIFGRNVQGEEIVVGAIDFNNLTGFINEPKRWGAEFRYNFF